MARLRVLGFVLLGAALCAPLTIHALPSADLWWHLALGRWIATHGSVPQTDPFSFTAQGRHWQNDEAVAAFLFYVLYASGGLTALHVMKSVVLMTAMVIAAWHASRRSSAPLWLSALVAWGCLQFSQYRYFVDVRPHIFSYFFLVLFAWLIHGYVSQPQTRRLVLFPLLAMVWSNLHAGVLIGAAMLAIAGVGLLAERRTRDGTRPLVAALSCILAACVCLVGVDVLTYPFRLWGLIWNLHLNEWQPVLRWSHGGLLVADGQVPFICFLSATALAMVVKWRAFRPYELLLAVAFGCLSLSGWRHVPLFCLLSIPWWTTVLASLVPSRLELSDRGWTVIGAVSMVTLCCTFGTARLAQQSLESSLFPRWACDFLLANRLPPRLFHPYGWGGYLLWRLAPEYQVFIDGRAVQVYPPELYQEYLDAAFQPARTDALLRRYDVDVVLCFANESNPEVSSRAFRGTEGWVSVYQDDLAEIFVRRTAATAALLKQFSTNRLKRPPSPYSLVAEGLQSLGRQQVAQAEAAARQALQMDPEYAPAALLLGVVCFKTGQGEAGVQWARRALEWNPRTEMAHFNLALYFASIGDRRQAREEARAELDIRPDNAATVRLLKSLGQ